MKTTPHLSTARHQTAAWGGCRAGPWTSAVDMAISKRNRRPIDCSCDARGNAPTAQQRPSNGPAPTLRGHGAYSYQTVPEADFQAWRDQRDWTAEKYRRFNRGERMPPDWKPERHVSG